MVAQGTSEDALGCGRLPVHKMPHRRHFLRMVETGEVRLGGEIRS
jgi:hypothetical protein